VPRFRRGNEEREREREREGGREGGREKEREEWEKGTHRTA